MKNLTLRVFHPDEITEYLNEKLGYESFKNEGRTIIVASCPFHTPSSDVRKYLREWASSEDIDTQPKFRYCHNTIGDNSGSESNYFFTLSGLTCDQKLLLKLKL